MNSSFDDGGQFAWDATSLTLWQTCPRKYYYKMVEGWQAKELSVHLWFGQHYATALEQYHKLRALEASHDEALIAVVRAALVNTWEHELDANGERIEGTGQPVKFVHSSKTRENLIRTIVWYFEHFEDDPCKTVLLTNGKPAVELSFTLPVENGIVFCGHMDRLVDYNGEVYVQDQKTSGSAVDSMYYFTQFNPDTQMSMYTFAGKAILGTPVSGVMIDAAQIMVGFTRFARNFTPRTDSQLNEWYDNTLDHITQARRIFQEWNCNERQAFPMNLASCGNYGGCEFRKVCSVSPHVRENFLNAEFTKDKRWDPLERR